MLVRHILSSVWERLSIFSQLAIIQHMGLCVFILPISLVMIERIYTLSYYHHQIGSMHYYPLFRVRSWNNCMLCMSLYILIHMDTLWGDHCYLSFDLLHHVHIGRYISVILILLNPIHRNLRLFIEHMTCNFFICVRCRNILSNAYETYGALITIDFKMI